MTTQPRNRTRRAARTAIYLLVQLAALFAVLEIGLRVARPHYQGLQTLLYQNVASTGFGDAATLEELLERSPLGFQPGVAHSGFVLNSRGLRTREYDAVKPIGTRRVLAFGDSFTFASGGLPASRHWTRRLEDELAQRGEEPRFEVLSLGVPGTGTHFQLRLWQLEGARMVPDLVLLAFFVGNDFYDVDLESPVETDDTEWIERLARRSFVVRALRNLARLGAVEQIGEEVANADGHPLGSELPGYAEAFDGDAPTFAEDAYLELEARRLALVDRRDTKRFERRFAQVAEVLTDFRREVEAVGARFVVLVIPDEFQVDQELLNAVTEHLGKSPSLYDLDLPQQRLGELAAAKGLEIVDVLPEFRRRTRMERLYRPRNTHWNAAGNALAAELLADKLYPSKRK